jgi:hypothetical protein
MKGTVNGKSLDQVLSELKAPFPEEELKKNEKNETYIPIVQLRYPFLNWTAFQYL